MRRAARSLLLTQSTLLQRGSSIGEALCIGASSTSDGPSSSHPLQEPLLLQFHQHQHHQQQSFSAVRHLSSLSSFWDNRFGRRAPASTAQQAAGDDASLAAQQEPSTWWPLPEGSDDALAAIAQAVRAGDLAAIAAAKQEAFFTSAWVMTGLQYFHDTQGLPWCAVVGPGGRAVVQAPPRDRQRHGSSMGHARRIMRACCCLAWPAAPGGAPSRR